MKYVLLTQHYVYKQTTQISYGIGLIDDSGTLIETVPNLSSDRAAVAQLTELCNTLSLDPLHLWDVVYDFLAAN